MKINCEIKLLCKLVLRMPISVHADALPNAEISYFRLKSEDVHPSSVKRGAKKRVLKRA